MEVTKMFQNHRVTYFVSGTEEEIREYFKTTDIDTTRDIRIEVCASKEELETQVESASS